jgi:opacity protein-like surface antigen
MHLRRSLILAFAFCVAAPFSQAGLYVKGAGLYNNPSDLQINNVAAFKTSLKSNIGLSGAVGYKFSMFRLEAELQRLSSDTESASTSTGVASVTGALKEVTGFANGYVDLPSFFGLGPYIGAGLGYVRTDFENFSISRGPTSLARYSGSDSVFGYQGMIGLQFSILRTATIHAGYRIMKRQDIAVRDVVTNAMQDVKLGDNRLFEVGLAFGF